MLLSLPRALKFFGTVMFIRLLAISWRLSMKVGDLVIYKPARPHYDGADRSRMRAKRLGIVMETERHALRNGALAQVNWGTYGTFWDPVANLEILK
jgi:hypothetical protein